MPVCDKCRLQEAINLAVQAESRVPARRQIIGPFIRFLGSHMRYLRGYKSFKKEFRRLITCADVGK